MPHYQDPVIIKNGRWLRYPLGGFDQSVDPDFDAIDTTDLADSIARFGVIDATASSIGIASDISRPVTDWMPERGQYDFSRRRKHKAPADAAHQQWAWEFQQWQKQTEKERVADAEWAAWEEQRRMEKEAEEHLQWYGRRLYENNILGMIKDQGFRNTEEIAQHIGLPHWLVFATCLDLVAERRLTAINEG